MCTILQGQVKPVMRKFFLIVALGIAVVGLAQNDDAPDWSLLMTDPNVNVHEVIDQFNSYWGDREITPGSGYKPFKRWEYLMHGRVGEDGRQASASAMLREFSTALQMKNARSENGNWRNLGPILDDLTSRANIPGVGRINHVAFHPTDPSIIFCGAPAGGVWRSYDGGNNWVSNTDDLPTLGVSAIAFDPFNPDIVYLGTGDRDAGDAPGMGMMRSTDGGLSWQFTNTGFEDQTIGDIAVDPENPGVVIAATRFGIRRSTDYGQSWQLTSNSMYYKQVLFKPGDSQIVYATAQGRFFKSTDNGQSWTMITNGVTFGSRFVIAVTPADPERVYICAANTFDFRALYVSHDAGDSFVTMSDTPNILGWSADGSAPGGQAWFDLCMVADPINPDRIFVGGIRMKRSDDAGATWVDIQNSFLHVDHHWCAFSPHDGQLYLCNDGGIYRYQNQMQWVDISHGIVSGQIYKFGQAPITANKALSGYQDNGTMEFNGVNWRRAGGADGFECQYDPEDESSYYSSIYYGQIYRTNNTVTNEKICGEDELGIDESGAWSTPWFVTPFNSDKMFVGLKNVWRAANIKEPNRDDIVWERISDDLIPVTENMVSMNQSRLDTNMMYVSKGTRRLFRTDNANAPANEVTWVNLSSQLPSGGVPVTAILAHPFDSNTVYIGFNNRVWKSTNKGIGWFEHNASMPLVRINSMVMDLTDNEGIYAATDRGVYYRNADMNEWISFSGNLPLGVRVTELEIYYGPTQEQHRLRASTYGRGMWESDLYGTTTIDFPATAWLRTPDNTTEVFGEFQVDAGFYRQLQQVNVTGFQVDDVDVTNGALTEITNLPNGTYRLTVIPDADGIVEIKILDEAAQDADGLLTYASQPLRLLNIPEPQPFGIYGPGGIGDAGDITLWLRADHGLLTAPGGAQVAPGEPIGVWEDALGNTLFAAQDDAEMRPTLLGAAEGINGMPAIEFNGINNALIAENIPSSSNLSVFSVVQGAEPLWNDHGWIASARQPNGFLIHPWRNTSLLNVSVLDNEENYASTGTEWIVSASDVQLYGLIYAYHPEAQLLQKVVNGSVYKVPSSNHGERLDGQPITVRYGWDFDERYGEGSMAEHVIYNRRLYESHRIIMSNYFGVKYGIDMAPEQVFDREDYRYEIAGIGRVSEYDFHADAQGSGAIRISNPDDLDNGEFLLWGHNGADLEWVNNVYPIESEFVNRIWAFQQTGDAGEVTVRVYADLLAQSTAPIGLIISDDDQFMPGSTPTFIPLEQSGDHFIANVQFPTSGVFTIGVAPIVGVENLSLSELSVYPNPAGQAVTIDLVNIAYEGAILRMFDPSGREVLSERPQGMRHTIALDRFAPGVYLIALERNGQRQVVRFVHY